ncbi:threonine/homoserine/homoserine lactone efflux protein [Streptacidiphilus sp. EB129]|jgi:hypothetical protein
MYRPMVVGGAAGMLAATGVNIGIALVTSLVVIGVGAFLVRRASFTRRSRL